MADVIPLRRVPDRRTPLTVIRDVRHEHEPSPPGMRPLVTVHFPCDLEVLRGVEDAVAAVHPSMRGWGVGDRHVLLVEDDDEEVRDGG